MDYRLAELLNISQLQQLLDHFYIMTGLAWTIIDVQGMELARTNYQDICSRFHHVCPPTAELCQQNINYIREHLCNEPFVIRQCRNGLMSYAVRIMIDNQYSGAILVEQFLHQPPDQAFFRRQARDYGFDEIPYLEALQQVQILPGHQLESMMAILLKSTDLMILNAITQKRQDKTLKESRVLRQLVMNAPLGIITVDKSGHIVKTNQKLLDILGSPSSEFTKAINMFTFPPLMESGISADLKRCINEDTAVIAEHSYNSQWDKHVYMRYHLVPIYDNDGQITGVQGMVEDITERKQAEDQLKYLSLHDPLTGLYNRTYFEQEMCRLDSGRHLPVGLIICDVDGLKLVNDTLGHDAGDTLLETAARIIKDCFREDDMVSRIGGDEFAILLPECNHDTLEKACNRLKDAVAGYNTNNMGLPLSISVGFAVSDYINVNINDLFKEADNNMYREKLHSHQSTQNAIAKTLSKALEEKDFIPGGHTDRLQNLMEAMAQTIGLPEHDIINLRLLAQFHDIGKVGISNHILFKPGPLLNKELIEMQRHSEIGHRIAQTTSNLVPISDWILKHHERWNGDGYPLGLKGEEIPLECRILAIIDAYDAMSSDRPYRPAMTNEEAILELKRCSGTQFDPYLVEVFIQMLEKQPQH